MISGQFTRYLYPKYLVKCLITAEKVTNFITPFSEFDPQLPPNGGREGGNDMTKYFGYKYLVNRPEIIEVYENPLGHFYCLLHTVCVKCPVKYLIKSLVIMQ